MTTIHIVGGPPCSGKSTYAKQLAADLDAELLNPDALYTKIADLLAPTPVGDFDSVWADYILHHLTSSAPDLVLDGATQILHNESFIYHSLDAIDDQIRIIGEAMQANNIEKELTFKIYWMTTSRMYCNTFNSIRTRGRYPYEYLSKYSNANVDWRPFYDFKYPITYIKFIMEENNNERK